MGTNWAGGMPPAYGKGDTETGHVVQQVDGVKQLRNNLRSIFIASEKLRKQQGVLHRRQ